MALDALVVEPASEVDRGPDRTRVRRGHRVLLAVAVVLVLVLVGTAVGLVAGDVARTNRQFDRTQRSLDVTQAHTRAVLADLTQVRQELGGVSVQVFLATKALAQDAADLTTAHSELLVAQSDVSNQTTVIADLQTCLGGVQQALNALSVNDQGRAIDALDSVAPQCNGAVASGA